MRFKSLFLAGFKTFADKTEIEFGEGLTAVVGPNGCGKSNIADALLWVMGEQNPRLVRGAENRDLIFAGTDRRRPVGMAEVRLTIDNSDRSLPIEFAEVTVSRRILRSGESQYMLNGAPCRLRDIVDLFLDTGAGRGAYSFVSQSEVDSVLSARPEDRRELFEEAAGIKKYRTRKREAMRKLEAAEANLTRIRDLAAELERQREPMAKQAALARRHSELTARLQQIEIDLLVAEIQKIDYDGYANRKSRDSGLEAIQNIDAELATLERTARGVGEQLAEADQELDAARYAQQSAMTALERTESQLRLIGERTETSERTADALTEELRTIAVRLTEAEREREATAESLEKVGREAIELAGRLLTERSRLDEANAALAEARRLGADRQGAIRRLAERRSKRQAAVAACDGRLTESRRRHEQVGASIVELQARAAEAEERRTGADVELAGLMEIAVARDAAVVLAESERRRLLGDVATARTALEAAGRRLAERESRLTALVEMQESGDGFHQGVRAVLGAVRAGELPGDYRPVVDVLSVPEPLRVAIEVALGSSAQDIVCRTEHEATRAIEWLKRHRAGRATFLPIPILEPAQPMPATAGRGVPGVVGVAGQLVGASREFEAVRSLLLGRVLVVEDMDAALLARREVRGWGRIVTLAGELLTPGGALTGGSLQGRGAHLVGRKGEIDDLRAVMPVERQATADLEEKVRELAAMLVSREAAARSAAEEQSRAHAAALGAQRDLEGAVRDERSASGRLDDARSELERVSTAIGALEAERAGWQTALDADLAEDSSLDDAADAVMREVEDLEARARDLRAEVARLDVEAGRAGERRSALSRAGTAADRRIAELTLSRAAKQEQRESAGVVTATSEHERAELVASRERDQAALLEHQANFDRWQTRKRELLQSNFGTASAIKEAGRQRASLLEEVHAAELQVARLEVRLAQSGQRLHEEYGVSTEEALSRPNPGDPGRDTVNEVARLRREVRAMGAVNLGAVEEYERLTERSEFLTGQSADLDAARAGLLAAIAEIDENTRGVFMETFTAVSEEFGRLFARLFGGGTTRLVLTTPDDVLETGIEIVAQPPGKRPQSLALLSGGERALTAVALLFSFLAVRPSPFALLDEVDAPLDGSNVEKFCELIRDFSRETQFLVITHNPTTMEMAPRWYGVTMQEPGVSRVLAYRVPAGTFDSPPAESVLPA